MKSRYLLLLQALLPVLVHGLATRGAATSTRNGISSTVVKDEEAKFSREEFVDWEYGSSRLHYNNAPERRLKNSTSANNDTKKSYRLAIVPLTQAGRYGTMIVRGCQEAAQLAVLTDDSLASVTCDAYGSLTDQTAKDFLGVQKHALMEIIANATLGLDSKYDAIAVSAVFPTVIGPLLDQARKSGIQVVTFDSDAPDSQRQSFVGSNNTFLGTQVSKVTKQLLPEGGSFAIITAHVGAAYVERTQAVQHELLHNSEGVWQEHEQSPAIKQSVPEILDSMEFFCQQSPPPTAVLILVYPPFDSPRYESLVDTYRHLNITFVGVGDTERQMDLLARKFVHGLVGPLYYEMGSASVQNMLRILKEEQAGIPTTPTASSTNVITHIQVPIVLPELIVDPNRVGHLAILGYAFFAIASLAGFAFAAWVWIYRDTRVVRASQPKFLLMVAFGVVVMSSGIVPLGLDDSHGTSTDHSIAICMAPPWLVATGFTMVFSALFSKTSRVNKIFKAGSAITRIKVKTHHVLLQFFVLLALNFLILTCWTILDPLVYVRVENPGTDGWNRVLSTRGACQNDQLAPYVIPLVLINMTSLAVANWQAYEARFIQSEFSEARYIGMTCVSLMQTALLGIPILLVVQDQPEALYLVLVCMIFVVSMAVLLLIFVPKMVLMENYNRYSQRTQGRMLEQVIREVAESAHSSHQLKRDSKGPPVTDLDAVSNISGLDNSQSSKYSRSSKYTSGHA